MSTNLSARGAGRARLAAWSLLAAFVLFFFRAWLGDGLPASPRLEALAPFTYIWQVAEYLRAGHLYVDWDPSFFAGYPWLRFLQSAVYYMAALLSLLPGLSLASALKAFIIGSYILSGWTMCELVRVIVRNQDGDERVAWLAGLAAGAAYAVFPFHLHLGIEIISHGAFWAIMPLPFLAYESGHRTNTASSAAPAPASPARPAPSSPCLRASVVRLGVSFALYGIIDIEHALLVGPFAALYIVLRELPALRQYWRTTLPMLAGAALIALALMAYYVVPALGEVGQVGLFARFGEGGAADAQFGRDTGLSVGTLLAGAADRAGVRYRPADLPYIVFGFFGANTWYVGVVTLGLATLGLLRLRRSPAVGVSAILLALAFAWAARFWLPVNLFQGMPFFGTLSGFRGMIHIGFFLCLLAGVGAASLLAALQRRPAQVALTALAAATLIMDRPRPTLAYVAEVAAIVALWGLTLLLARRRQPARLALAGLLLLILVGADYRTASAAVVSLPSYFQSDELDAYQWLNAQGDGFRLWEFTDLYDDAEFLHTFSLAYNQTPRFGGYYDNGATQAQWHLYKWAKPERGRTPAVDAVALRTALRLSSVRYVLVHRRIGAFDDAMALLRDIGFDHVAWQTPNVTVLEDRAWLPMARVYRQSVGVAAGQITDELDLLPTADSANTAIVGDLSAGAAPTMPSMADAPVTATMQRTHPYVIQIQTEMDAPGLLVVAESWHRNWLVTVDGQPATLLRANVAFMAVQLDAGKHDVLYSYGPSYSLVAGAALSLLTSLGLVWAAFRRRRPLHA